MTSSPGTSSPGRATCGTTRPEPGRNAQPAAAARRRAVAALLAAALLGSPAPRAQDPVPAMEQTAVVELRHRTPEEILPALGPHAAGRPVSLSAAGGRLLLRGPTAELGHLIDLIGALDVPAQLLWITVTLADGPLPQPRAAGTRLATGGPPPGRGDTTAVWRTERTGGRRLLVREGEWASVAVLPAPAQGAIGARITVAPGLEVFTGNAGTPAPPAGFRVRPRLVGEGVLLELAVLAPGRAPFSLDPVAQTLASTLSGRLGEWMTVSASADALPLDEPGSLVARTRPKGLPAVLVRVDAAEGTLP